MTETKYLMILFRPFGLIAAHFLIKAEVINDALLCALLQISQPPGTISTEVNVY